tara:strand:- start:259 stop:1083 length:825 start_codon:yes stop_codon:yes gene_type:complete
LLSWPAVILFLAGSLIFGLTSFSAINGNIPFLLATLINGVCLYFFFSLLHESIHETVSTNKLVNDLLGRISLFMLVPLAPLEIARWIHLNHHGHTTCDNDPDNFMHHGKWWVLPLRWANFDVYYISIFVKEWLKGGPVARRHGFSVLVYVTILLSIITAFVTLGFGYEFLLLWVLPSRIGLALVGFVFVFLPHHPADISAHDNKYQASTVRQGWEWILTPLMVFQNYHLIHHLYPNVPFYNYLKIWHLRYDELTSKEPALQTAFGLKPVNRKYS